MGTKSRGGIERNLAGIGLPEVGFERTSVPLATYDAAEPNVGMKPSLAAPPPSDLGPIFRPLDRSPIEVPETWPPSVPNVGLQPCCRDASSDALRVLTLLSAT